MAQITLTISSRLDDVPLLGELVGFVCRRAGLTPLEANGVEVCVVEAANNSIKHAYLGDASHAVWIEIDLLPALIALEVCDSGRSADAARINRDHGHAFDLDPEHPEEFRESGRGLAIIQQVMDSYEYTPGRERNRFRLTKRLKDE